MFNKFCPFVYGNSYKGTRLSHKVGKKSIWISTAFSIKHNLARLFFKLSILTTECLRSLVHFLLWISIWNWTTFLDIRYITPQKSQGHLNLDKCTVIYSTLTTLRCIMILSVDYLQSLSYCMSKKSYPFLYS